MHPEAYTRRLIRRAILPGGLIALTFTAVVLLLPQWISIRSRFGFVHTWFNPASWLLVTLACEHLTRRRFGTAIRTCTGKCDACGHPATAPTACPGCGSIVQLEPTMLILRWCGMLGLFRERWIPELHSLHSAWQSRCHYLAIRARMARDVAFAIWSLLGLIAAGVLVFRLHRLFTPASESTNATWLLSLCCGWVFVYLWTDLYFVLRRCRMRHLAISTLAGSGLPLCPKCGYNLTANSSGICPECGTACKPVQ